MKLAVPQPEQAEAIFKIIQPTVMTTFHLPHAHQHGEMVVVNMVDLVERMPYAAFAVHETFTLHSATPEFVRLFAQAYGPNAPAEANGEETVLLARGDKNVVMVSKITLYDLPGQRGNRRTFYAPRESKRTTKDGVTSDPFASACTIKRLYDMLYNRRERMGFVEQAVSRQVKRAENRPPEYREFIVVKRDSPVYRMAANPLTPGQMVKRMKQLHSVMGHQRTFKADRYKQAKGKTIFIEPFVRGQGKALQVKDYRVKVQEQPRVNP
jgi:hypothetical protein